MDFLECYYQSELYPVDLFAASKECFLRFDPDEFWWDFIVELAHDEFFVDLFGEIAVIVQNWRPAIQQTPHIYFNAEYSALAAVDFRKSLCRVTVSL